MRSSSPEISTSSIAYPKRKPPKTYQYDSSLSPALLAEDLLGLAVDVRAQLAGLGHAAPVRAPDHGALRAGNLPAFTIAHKLGHWISQCLEGTAKPVSCRAEEIGVDPKAKVLEREANIFAANLVRPEPAVRDAHATGDTARFGMSDEAMAWRLHNLGLVKYLPGGVGNGG